MRVRSALLVSLVVALLLSVGPTTAVALDDHDQRDDQRQDIVIELQDDGDAIWTVEYHRVLANESEREQFQTFADEVRSGERDVRTDRSTFAQFLPYAEERTGREMAIQDASWDRPTVRPVSDVAGYNATAYSNETQVGTLRFSFTWTNFAEVDGSHLRLQDTFLTASGDPWYSEVGSNQRLVLQAPENHDFVRTPHGIDNNRIVWEGPTLLGPDDYDIVLVSRAGVLGFLRGSWPLLLGGLSLVAVAGGLIWYVRTRDDEWDDDAPLPDWWPASEAFPDRIQRLLDGSSNGDAGGPSTPPADDPVEQTTTEAETSDVDPELLSDEERVVHMLTENGGRMKQAAIVDETGWSNAKVSQLLSQMDDDDEIEKLRIGRENLITLPDVDPTQIE
ncbi:helix-turn-helix transcriptional regulator [Halovivax cerinus]|uniref:Helix-turn-helix transcriptional regulator n=1 Tax=Halovivax cerinus TaxID=1487865 RepID=A0ABD5NKW7_9EURY|nr:hypothetical protein [Halovivax cerinus]